MPKYEAGDFREMRPDDLPFSAEGMTVSEIEAFYKGAKDKNEAVGILADCNAAKREQMTLLLSERGLLSGTPQQKEKRKRSNTAEVLEQVTALADEGKTAQEIARIRGVGVDTIYQFCHRHGIRLTDARGEKRAKPKPAAKEQPKMQSGGGTGRSLLPKRPRTASPRWRVSAGRSSSGWRPRRSASRNSAARPKICVCAR